MKVTIQILWIPREFFPLAIDDLYCCACSAQNSDEDNLHENFSSTLECVQ